MSVENMNVVISKEQKGARKHVRVLNAETGEVVSSHWEGTMQNPGGRPVGGKEAEFFRVYRTNWLDIIRKGKLTVHEAGFFMFMLGFVKWESNFLVHPDTGENLTVSSLANLVKMDRSNVADMVNKLNNRGLIAVVKRGDGRENNFLLNSNVAFFGKYLKDMSEHTMFADVEYQPAVRIKYKEPPAKE